MYNLILVRTTVHSTFFKGIMFTFCNNKFRFLVRYTLRNTFITRKIDYNNNYIMFSYCYHLYISLIYVKEVIQGKFIGKVRVIDIIHIDRIQKKKRKSE